MAKSKVLIVCGSESGTAKRGIEQMIKTWEGAGKDFEIVGVTSGKRVGADLTALRNCDVLLISTSSYGDGEAPANYTAFFTALSAAAASGEKPLAGLQHAVLGWGCSMFDTYQNIPRLTDKYLGECGSRRLAQRAELDDCGDEDQEDQPMYKRWDTEVQAALKQLPAADAAPVCEWKLPASTITVHDGSSGGHDVIAIGVRTSLVIVAGGLLVLVVYYMSTIQSIAKVLLLQA